MSNGNGRGRDLAEWDAEIEADFQRVVAASKRPREIRKRQPLIGCPWGFLADVCRLTRGRSPVLVALYIYRRTQVCHSMTVTLLGPELAELGIDRRRKREALAKLLAAGLIRIEKQSAGHSTRVTLLWRRAAPSAG